VARNWHSRRRVATRHSHKRGPSDRLACIVTDVASLTRDAAMRWIDDECYRLAPSLAYYALFSLFPLMLICLTGVGFLLGDDDSVRGRLLASVAGSTSAASRSILDETLQSMQQHRTARGVGAVVGFVVLFLASSGAFSELQSALNRIWRVKDVPSKGVWDTIVRALLAKAFSFGVAIAAAFAILASLVLSTTLVAIASASVAAPGVPALWQVIDTAASIGFLWLLIAAVYKMVPQTSIRWRDVLGGALLASLLFTGLKGLFAWYLGHIGNYAAYGAVGGVLGLLTWIYLASLLLFYGAAWSRVYAERFGSLRAAGTNLVASGLPGVPLSATVGREGSPAAIAPHAGPNLRHQ
jgi:membrane protein